MVKTVVKKSGSKIRFVMVDAELSDGENLTEITRAISNALQPTPGRRLISAPARPEGTDGGNGAAVDEGQPETEHDEVQEIEVASRSTKPRKPTIPKVLDVDLKSGDMPWEDFATKKAPNSDLSRHLVVAYWFKKYRDTEWVTADHAFTCYKKAGWSVSIVDFAQPFRDLARLSRKGEWKAKSFTINQIGEDAVEKMGTK
jgi:hypothetical protein